jgi:hypothetical protein
MKLMPEAHHHRDPTNAASFIQPGAQQRSLARVAEASYGKWSMGEGSIEKDWM